MKKAFEIIKNIFKFIIDNAKWILIFICMVLAFIMFRQCRTIQEQKDEKTRLENNLLAANDTLKNYRENGWTIASMRAMQLRLSELADSLKMERGKTPITIIKYVTSVKDTFLVQTIVVHDTTYITEYPWSDNGVIVSKEHTVFGKSWRNINITTPYYVDCETGKLNADGESSVTMQQNIWVESTLYRDKKGYTYLQLKTDYPACTFNSGTAILVSEDNYEYKSRRQFGVGLGLQVGYGASVAESKIRMSPYVGIGLSLNWNPRFLQF